MAEPINSQTLDKSLLEKFTSLFRGKIINPENADYDAARSVYNGYIDKYPTLIAQCTDISDVILALQLANEHSLTLSVRGGGHNVTGSAIAEDGLVIDLSRMKGIRVDPESTTVRVEAGCTLGDLDHATHSFGYAVPTGIASTTGIAGLTLGGGLGHLTRKYGWTIDNLLEADVVLADGTFVTASERQHEDLFWALRGGGGNFGVVTSFLFRMHPVSMLYAGPLLWALEDLPEVMRFYRDFIRSAPKEVSGFFVTMVVPAVSPFPENLQGKKVCGVLFNYTGDSDHAEEVFAPVRAFKPPVLDWLAPIPLPALQSMFDWLYPPGLLWHWKGAFVDHLSEEAIRIHHRFAEEIPTALSGMHLYLIDGAAHDLPREATALYHRDARWAISIVGVDPDPANYEKCKDWTQTYWKELLPHTRGASYINFLMEEGSDKVEASFGDHYQRLQTVKKKYDPTNLFRSNQNIKVM